jgi:Fic family protein
MKRTTGNYTKLGNLNYFVPNPLPPNNPNFEFNNDLIDLYGSAMQALGQLNEMSNRIPNKSRFIKAYCLKEAIQSSAIEGINTTLIEIFTKKISSTENKNKINKQTQLVLNYNEALDRAIHKVRDNDFPIVSRIILDAHKTLMSDGDGEKASPGKYRKQQVQVGNLIPPPANEIENLIANLEKFINEDNSLPAIIRAGLAHVQFETIHPFLDGNGRIGRLLIVLMLIQNNILSAPILYPSTYFKKHHLEYYHRLDSVRTKGDFEGWISFYLQAIKESADDAYKRAIAIENLEKKINDKILSCKLFSKNKLNQAKQVLSILFNSPAISVKNLQEELKISYNTAASIIDKFLKLDILTQQEEGKKRDKTFSFKEYLELLDQDFLNEKG